MLSEHPYINFDKNKMFSSIATFSVTIYYYYYYYLLQKRR